MVAIAGAIVRQRTGKFDPSTFRDSYQEALQQLIEAKMKGLAIRPRAVSTPPPAIDLMAALKRSLAEKAPTPKGTAASRERRNRAAPDRQQTALLVPLSGGSKRKGERSAEPDKIGTRRRRKA
jgi:DNA end-binding protein Ku